MSNQMFACRQEGFGKIAGGLQENLKFTAAKIECNLISDFEWVSIAGWFQICTVHVPKTEHMFSRLRKHCTRTEN